MNLIYAIATDQQRILRNRHFGDADRYLIYQAVDEDIIFLKELSNPYITSANQEHGNTSKGMKIIELLQREDVRVLVSKKFGKNIGVVNKHFIPVIVSKNKPEEVIELLKQHQFWFEDELKNKKENYSQISINFGVLKTRIDQNGG